ncbi:MAG: indole-3-glycerol phosphate synthase TrpC, partial [Thermomicrobiales bacterium]
MSLSTGTYLDRILVRTAEDLAERKLRIPEERLRDALAIAPAVVPFAAARHRDCVSVVAEFKRASPSRGVFDFDGGPAEVAADYVAGGAFGISCLTDSPFFQGSLEDLDIVVAVAHAAVRPASVLRKDFMIDSYQIVEARVHGADCILLIAAALDDHQLADYRIEAEAVGMSVLVEVHDEAERERALASGATFLGINNRDLRTFKVDLATTERLAIGLDSDVVLIAESGIATRSDVERMATTGAAAVLVGESLILQTDRIAAVRQLA